MLNPVVHFMTRQLHDVKTATGAADVVAMRALSEARELEALVSTMPLPIYSYDEQQGRLRHEPGHCVAALDSGASGIEAFIRPDGSGATYYSRIENHADAITTHLAGFAAEAKYYPPSLRRYADGCFDFIAAKLLIDAHNAAGGWPPISCEAAARSAVAFVDARWKQINALALVLGSAGSLTEFEVRLFSECVR